MSLSSQSINKCKISGNPLNEKRKDTNTHMIMMILCKGALLKKSDPQAQLVIISSEFSSVLSLSWVRNVMRPICCEYIKCSSPSPAQPPVSSLCGFNSNNSNCFPAHSPRDLETGTLHCTREEPLYFDPTDDRTDARSSHLSVGSVWFLSSWKLSRSLLLLFLLCFPCSS